MGDASAISHILAKYQNRAGHDVGVLLGYRGRRGYDIDAHYGEEGWRRVPARRSPVWSNAGRRGLAFAARFSDLVCREAKKYDIVHIHVDADLVPLVRKRHPDKTIVLHHHGDRLRLEPRASLERLERHADKVLVSTPDLREYGGHEWLPNPVDTDLFAGRSVSRNGKGLYLLLGGEPADAKSRALDDPRMEVEWVLHDSTRDTVRYADMPDMLSRYEYYIDVKWLPIGSVMKALSSTGLQALSVGCKVVDHDFAVHEGLPDAHRPERVVARLAGHYEEAGRRGRGGTG